MKSDVRGATVDKGKGIFSCEDDVDWEGSPHNGSRGNTNFKDDYPCRDPSWRTALFYPVWTLGFESFSLDKASDVVICVVFSFDLHEAHRMTSGEKKKKKEEADGDRLAQESGTHRGGLALLRLQSPRSNTLRHPLDPIPT